MDDRRLDEPPAPAAVPPAVPAPRVQAISLGSRPSHDGEPRPHPELSAPELGLRLRILRAAIVVTALVLLFFTALLPWYIYETPLTETFYSPLRVVFIFGEPQTQDWNEFERERVRYFGLDSSALASLYQGAGLSVLLLFLGLLLASVAGFVAPPRVGALYFTRAFLIAGLVLLATAVVFALSHPSAWAHDYPYIDPGEYAGGSFWGQSPPSSGGGAPGYRWYPSVGWHMALALGVAGLAIAFINARWLKPSLPPITPPGAVDEKDLLPSDFCVRCGARLERPYCWRCGKKNR